jgi:hypothetical protein
MKLGDIVKYRNYFILLIIYIFTICFVFYCSSIYKNSLNNLDDNNVNDLSSSSYSVLYTNVYSYSLENSDFTIYVSNSYNIEDKYLFIDFDKVSVKDMNRLISDFGYDFSISKNYSYLINFSDGKIISIEVIE